MIPAASTQENTTAQGQKDTDDKKEKKESVESVDRNKKFQEAIQSFQLLDLDPYILLNQYMKGQYKQQISACSATLPLIDGTKKTFEGTAYILSAKSGEIAFRATNLGNRGPGTLRIGLRFPNNRILELFEVKKRKGYDFSVQGVNGKGESTYGRFLALKTHPEYDQNPLAIQNELGGNTRSNINYNWNDGDTLLVSEKDILKGSHDEFEPTYFLKSNQVECSLKDGRTFKGTGYELRANKGIIALQMTNVGNNEPGRMRVGLKLPDKKIMKLLDLEKTKEQEFFLQKIITGHEKESPTVVVAVLKTPDVDYNKNPIPFPEWLGGSKAKNVDINCEENDVWVAAEDMVERTHSPTPSPRR